MVVLAMEGFSKEPTRDGTGEAEFSRPSGIARQRTDSETYRRSSTCLWFFFFLYVSSEKKKNTNKLISSLVKIFQPIVLRHDPRVYFILLFRDRRITALRWFFMMASVDPQTKFVGFRLFHKTVFQTANMLSRNAYSSAGPSRPNQLNLARVENNNLSALFGLGDQREDSVYFLSLSTFLYCTLA